jgi:hypothetical protein
MNTPYRAGGMNRVGYAVLGRMGEFPSPVMVKVRPIYGLGGERIMGTRVDWDASGIE